MAFSGNDGNDGNWGSLGNFGNFGNFGNLGNLGNWGNGSDGNWGNGGDGNWGNGGDGNLAINNNWGNNNWGNNNWGNNNWGNNNWGNNNWGNNNWGPLGNLGIDTYFNTSYRIFDNFANGCGCPIPFFGSCGVKENKPKKEKPEQPCNSFCRPCPSLVCNDPCPCLCDCNKCTRSEQRIWT